MKKRILWTCITVFWSLFIFSQSLNTGETSGAMSGSITAFLLQFLPIGEELLHTLIRKGAHFAEYFVLGTLLVNTFRTYGLFPRKWDFTAPLLGCFWAVLDEFIQTLVPDRAGMVADVLLDSAGVFCGTLVVLAVIYCKKKKENTVCSV